MFLLFKEITVNNWTFVVCACVFFLFLVSVKYHCHFLGITVMSPMATMAIIYNTNISYAYDTTRACLSLLYLGLCQPVERLSVSDVDMDGSCSLALAQMTACYAIISETNLHCSHLAALSASGASACAAS